MLLTKHDLDLPPWIGGDDVLTEARRVPLAPGRRRSDIYFREWLSTTHKFWFSDLRQCGSFVSCATSGVWLTVEASIT
jgi:hypothetical protein